MSDKPEYTLVKDITTYVYPTHMKRPEGFFGSNLFEKWIPRWRKHLSHLIGKPNIVGIEIGVLNGDCTVFCATEIATGEGSMIYAVDINEPEFLINNIAPYRGKNVTFIKGESWKVFRDKFKENTADYIYIDGSHLAIDVLRDAVYAFDVLKPEGILIFDDYGWGVHTTDEKQKPKLAIDSFLQTYMGNYEVIEMG